MLSKNWVESRRSVRYDYALPVSDRTWLCENPQKTNCCHNSPGNRNSKQTDLFCLPGYISACTTHGRQAMFSLTLQAGLPHRIWHRVMRGLELQADGMGRACLLQRLWLRYCVRDTHGLGQMRCRAASQPDNQRSVSASVSQSCCLGSTNEPGRILQSILSYLPSMTVGLGMLEGLSQPKPFKKLLMDLSENWRKRF